MTLRMQLKSRRSERETPHGRNSKRPSPRTTQGKSSANVYLINFTCRWVIFDLEWNEDDGRKVSKIVFMLFSPDENHDNTEKFIVACNKDQLKAKIPETNRDWQVNSWDDIVKENIVKTFQ